MSNKILESAGIIFGFLLIPICFFIFLLLLPIVPFIIIYYEVTSKAYAKSFHEKYESKKFLFIYRNDAYCLKVYNEVLENKIGKDTVVLEELELNNDAYKLERKIYRLALPSINYIPVLIYFDNTINRFGLYYEFKDYLKGKTKKINRFLKKLNKTIEKNSHLL
ncbi:MAG: hypothetical protein U0U67_00675 [Chitinophagales bacterium]